jgi:hypothetical protein
VASGRGYLKFLLATTSVNTVGVITIYDNTAGSGTVLAVLYVWNMYPLNVTFPLGGLQFSTGCTVVCSQYVSAQVIVEN